MDSLMSGKIKQVREGLEETGDGIQKIIDIYKRVHPQTIVWYWDGSVSSYEIKGELATDSIPNKDNAVKIEIGSKVVSIGDEVFQRCPYLTSIKIPDSVTSIGDSVFYGCQNLTSIDIPSSVTGIGNWVFTNCSSLTSVNIPSNITSIGHGMFSGCLGFTSFVIPSNIASIGFSAFSNCKNLTSINIPSGVASIEDSAFSGCQALSSITSLRTSAPTVKANTFGRSNNTSTYTGRNSYLSGSNVLKIPQGATGYDSGAWLDPLQNASKCGFHIEYL